MRQTNQLQQIREEIDSFGERMIYPIEHRLIHLLLGTDIQVIAREERAQAIVAQIEVLFVFDGLHEGPVEIVERFREQLFQTESFGQVDDSQAILRSQTLRNEITALLQHIHELEAIRQQQEMVSVLFGRHKVSEITIIDQCLENVVIHIVQLDLALAGVTGASGEHFRKIWTRSRQVASVCGNSVYEKITVSFSEP